MAANWQLVKDQLPHFGTEVMGYHPEWEDPDYNPTGVCVCYLQDGEPNYWLVAKWCGQHDEWHTRYSKEAQENLGDANEGQPYIDAPIKWINKPR